LIYCDNINVFDALNCV